MRVNCLSVFFCVLSVYATAQSPSSSKVVSGTTGTPSAKVSKQFLQLPQPHYQADFTPVIANGFHSVSWNRGLLVSFSLGESKEPVRAYDRTGNRLFESFLIFENAFKTFVQDALATSSGGIVVAGSALTADGASADFITEILPTGIQRTIRTSPFYPMKVCTTNEGTVWAYGKELNEARAAEPREHYAMLREYSFEKGELRSALDRATVRPPTGVPVGGKLEELQMRCNDQTVVLVNGPTGELIEYDLSTSHLNRWPLAPLPDGVDITRITGAALSDSGKIYVSTYDAPHVDALTRILQIHVNPSGIAGWVSVAAVPSERKWFVLLGSDGDSLVYSRGRRSPTLFWSKTREVAK